MAPKCPFVLLLVAAALTCTTPVKWIPPTLFIQNASELPVDVHTAELAIDTLGYQNVFASVGNEPPQVYADKRTGPVKPAFFFPGTVTPGQKWRGQQEYTPDGHFDSNVRPRINIIQLAITDAAGHEWDMRPSQGRPPRRVRWRREWPWRHGRLSPPGANRNAASRTQRGAE